MMRRAVILPATSSETPQDVVRAVYAARDRAENAASNVQNWLNEVGTEVGSHSYVTAKETVTARSLADRFADVVNVKDFGAIGDGVVDDTAAIQAALDVASGKCVYIPAGVYVISGEGCRVPSNCAVIGAGIGVTVLYNAIAPKLQTPYADTVFQSALYTDCGVENVEICDMSIHGPQYKKEPSWLLMSNGISIRGRYYQQRKNLPRDNENYNIYIHSISVVGYGYAGIDIDNATNAHVYDCDIDQCVAFGIRFLGCNDFRASRNKITNIYPGDIENNINRVYGITATRVYGNTTTDLLPDGTVNPEITSVYRRCENGTFSENTIINCITWKGLDTHGGKNIKFINNTITDCNMAIGVDMGGYEERQGFVRVEDILISGNSCYRYAPARDDEGYTTVYVPPERYATPGAAIHCSAKAGGAVDISGYNLKIVGNDLYGWGEKGRRCGAIDVVNYKNVVISGNTIRNSRGAAISSNGFLSNCIIENNIIRDVRLTDAAFTEPFAHAIGLGLEDIVTSNCIITNNVICNSLDTDLIGLAFSPLFGEGIRIGENQYIKTGIGAITRYSNPSYVPRCYVSGEMLAHGRIPSGAGIPDGGDMSTAETYGISSIKKVSVGVYDVILYDTVFSRQAAEINITPIGSGLGDMGFHAVSFAVDSNGNQYVRVSLRNNTGASVDRPVYIAVRALAL
ncbi:hypothetical protein CNY67_06955 [Desulfovibrio sp. G11]|nr:hypothetical protein CNY67_06955 [Desulfovibrio sp. G11]